MSVADDAMENTLCAVQFFVRRCNQELADKAAAETVNLATLPVQQRLHTLLRWRLQMIQPYLGAISTPPLWCQLCQTYN